MVVRKTHPSGYICEKGSRLNEGLGPKSAMPPMDRLYEARLNLKSGLYVPNVEAVRSFWGRLEEV